VGAYSGKTFAENRNVNIEVVLQQVSKN
jgi:hypothetical protein